MNLEKLFGSKTKVDILKYLIFRRQGVSMRALEAELWWTFPAIKKQVDSLEESEVVDIEKESSGRSISIKKEFFALFKEFFFQSLKYDLTAILESWGQVRQHFRGDKFGKEIGIDLIIIYNEMEKTAIDQLKHQINETFREYRIESVSIVFMSHEEREKRYRLADRFVLQVMRYYNTYKN